MKKFLLSVAVFVCASIGFSQAPCTDLFFSEYVEGSAYNKAIEIYNPTSSPVNLNGYYVYKYLNGGAIVNDTLALSGTLMPGGVYIAVNDSATATLMALGDTIHSITFFNGDDALSLYHGATMIDVIGDVGNAVDPGTEWVVGSGSTANHTLVRKSNVFAGTVSWATGATQWDVYASNDFTHLGSHTMASCATAGITNEQAWDVAIFPNPTSGYITITSEINDYSLQIFDLTGKAVVTKTNLSNTTQIDLTDLTNGIYMVKLNNGSNQLTKKVIVRK